MLQHDLVSSLVKRKRPLLEPPKKKKQSVIEVDLINYFRCSFEIPGGWKMQMRSGESQKFSRELAMLVNLLNVNLDLPHVEDMLDDESIHPIDKEILTTYLSRNNEDGAFDFLPEPEPFETGTDQIFGDEAETAVSPVFVEVKPSFEMPEVAANIDYTPHHDLTSLYINLPLMNFDQDKVVADRNQDPSFYEPPIRDETNVEETERPSTSRDQERYVCPPNLTTLVGLRTYLLNRRNLAHWSNLGQHEDDDCVVESDELLQEAQNKFDKRLFCLFLWPALMSRYAPSPGNSIFLDGGEDQRPSTSVSAGSARNDTSQEQQQKALVPEESVQNVCSSSLECQDESPPTKKSKISSKQSKKVLSTESGPLDP